MFRILLILFFVSAGLSQTNPVVQVAEKLNNGYKLMFDKNQVMLFNSCDTLRINISTLTKKQINKIEKLWKAEIKKERLYRKYAANLLRRKVNNQLQEKRYINFYAILNKNKALLAAKNRILGIDSSRVLNARHSLDSTEIVMRFKISDSDTNIVKQQYNLGNLILPTWKYFTVDSLRNFLNKSVRWTSTNQ